MWALDSEPQATAARRALCQGRHGQSLPPATSHEAPGTKRPPSAPATPSSASAASSTSSSKRAPASSAPQPACALLYGMATSIPGWLLSTLTSFALLVSASPAPAQSQGGAGTVWGTLAKPKGRQVHTGRGQGFLAAQRVGSRRPVAGGQGLEPDCSPARHPHHVLTLLTGDLGAGARAMGI